MPGLAPRHPTQAHLVSCAMRRLVALCLCALLPAAALLAAETRTPAHRVVSLPMHPYLTDEHIARVVQAVKAAAEPVAA